MKTDSWFWWPPACKPLPQRCGKRTWPQGKESHAVLGQLKFKARMVLRHRLVGCFPAGTGSMSRGLAFSTTRNFLGETLQEGTRLEGAEGSSLKKHGPWVQTWRKEKKGSLGGNEENGVFYLKLNSSTWIGQDECQSALMSWSDKDASEAFNGYILTVGWM